MSSPEINEGFVVFVLFFGLALLTALQQHSWSAAAFWIAMAALFAYAGRRTRRG